MADKNRELRMRVQPGEETEPEEMSNHEDGKLNAAVINLLYYVVTIMIKYGNRRASRSGRPYIGFEKEASEKAGFVFSRQANSVSFWEGSQSY